MTAARDARAGSWPNVQVVQKYGPYGAKRPLGPAGNPWVHNCSASCGASRFGDRPALGGFNISAPLPAISHLLFEASSQAVGPDVRLLLLS